MRLAFLAASTYAQNQQLSELPNMDAALDVLGQRLAEGDANFFVHLFPAQRGLLEGIDQILQQASEPVEAAVFFFHGYALVNDERGPALLLDGERIAGLSLKRLRRTLAERVESCLFILDTVGALEERAAPADAVQALGSALVGDGPGSAHVLCSYRPAPDGEAPRSAFSNLLELVLDWQSGAAGLTAADLFLAMRQEEALFAELPAAHLFEGTQPFFVLTPGSTTALSVRPSSGPPPAPESVDAASEQLPELADVQTTAEVLAALRRAPRHAAAYRTALRIFERAQDADGAWNAACALDLLGEADINESLLADTHQPEGLLPVQGRLLDEDWQRKLLAPERPGALDSLFAILDRAAVLVGLETARRKRRLPALDPSFAQDLEASTATLAKTLVWTSKLLGTAQPKLYVLPELVGHVATVPAHEPTLLASRSLGSGLSLQELAFLWGRQLATLQPEQRLASLYAPEELRALVLAAVSLGGMPQLPFKRLGGDAKLFARGLKRHLPKSSQEPLKIIASAFPLRETRQLTDAWARAVECSASRAGLLACGSLEVAAKALERFPLTGLLSAEEQLSDLLVYSLSAEYAALRQRLGVGLRAP